MGTVFKKAKFLLQLWDGIWSIPLAFLLFVASGFVVQFLFADPLDPQGAPGFYDPSFIQAAFYASAMMPFINFTAFLGLYFNFRGLFKYFVGTREDNKSKTDFLNLKSWQRILCLLAIYVFFSVEWLCLFRMLL